LGGHSQGAFAPAFDHLSSGRVFDQPSPWSGGGSNNLARQAGLDDIGRGPAGSDTGAHGRAAGLFDSAADETDTDDGSGDDDRDDGGDDFGGGGDDFDSSC